MHIFGALSSSYICFPFLIHAFKSRLRPLFAFLRINNCIELNSVWQKWSRTRRKGFLKSRVFNSVLNLALYPVDSLEANLISYLRQRRRMPNNIWHKYPLEFPFKYAACMHCNALVDSLQNWPPQLWFMLWIMQNPTMCAIKNAFLLFSSLNSKPRKHRYLLSDFNGCAFLISN